MKIKLVAAHLAAFIIGVIWWLTCWIIIITTWSWIMAQQQIKAFARSVQKGFPQDFVFSVKIIVETTFAVLGGWWLGLSVANNNPVEGATLYQWLASVTGIAGMGGYIGYMCANWLFGIADFAYDFRKERPGSSGATFKALVKKYGIKNVLAGAVIGMCMIFLSAVLVSPLAIAVLAAVVWVSGN